MQKIYTTEWTKKKIKIYDWSTRYLHKNVKTANNLPNVLKKQPHCATGYQVIIFSFKQVFLDCIQSLSRMIILTFDSCRCQQNGSNNGTSLIVQEDLKICIIVVQLVSMAAVLCLGLIIYRQRKTKVTLSHSRLSLTNG